MTTPGDIRARAQAWVDSDPDPDTCAAGQALIDAGDDTVLMDHFGSRLTFGTAGMRGAMGPGPNRMNRALIRQVTAGLGRYLRAVDPMATADGVVIGFDGRHGSRAFTEEAASVLMEQGFIVHVFDTVCPTPRLAHSVPFLGASAGIMVTASHNPPSDNGYKVYWRNGAQIIPPHDAGISDAIDAGGVEKVLEPGERRSIPANVWADYQAQVLSLRVYPMTGVRAVYTAMHGVGWRTLQAVLEAGGHHDVHPVPEQRDPDGDFPTVRFPNPEEPGAMDLAMAYAKEMDADLVIAHDPDADRLAVGLPDAEGRWSLLTGNDVGVLLAEELLTHGEPAPNRMVGTTIVSTSLLRRIAEAHGVVYAETLTGFKWLASRGLSHDGPFVIGFEEALGYTVGEVVRDKDGISAALVVLDMTSRLASEGHTLRDALDDIHRRHGAHLSGQRAVTLPGQAGADKIAAALNDLRLHPPSEVNGVPVIRIRDVATGVGSDLSTGEAFVVDLPSSNVIEWLLEDNTRILARPSGTEPKVKFYVECVEPVAENERVAFARSRAGDRLKSVLAWMQERTGL